MKPYNEVFDSQGELRPAYRAFQKRTGYDPLKPSAEWTKTCFSSPLGDQISFFPIPLIVDEAEYQDVLKPGIQQRVRAFQHFFRDVAIGEGQILKPGAPLEDMPLDWLFRDQGFSLEYVRQVWQGMSEGALRFVYGPDMIRHPEGRWMIVEDNIGVIGGQSEAFHILNTFLEMTKTTLNTVSEVRNDLEVGVRAFLEDAGVDEDPANVVGLLPYDDLVPALTPFELDSTRKSNLLQSLGIESWTLTSLSEQQRERALSGQVKAFVNFTSAKWKPKKQFHIELFNRRKIPMFEAPMIKYTSTKGYLPFIEKMVRFYLDEEPILRSSETHIMKTPEFPADAENWVLKRADEAEGKGVVILPKLFASQRVAAQEMVNEWSKSESGYVMVKQRYLPPSYIPSTTENSWMNFLVDLRPITYAYGFEKIHVGENMNARAISSLGDPRNCITRGAMALPVIREKV